MKCAIDISGVITEYPEIFKQISANPGWEITILTSMDKSMKKVLEKALKNAGIRYDKMAFTSYKVQYIIENGIDLFFDDSDHNFVGLPASVCVCKVRGKSNFDYETGKWKGQQGSKSYSVL